MNVVCIGGGITGQMVQLVVPETRLLDWRPADQGHRPQTRRYGANYLWKPIPGLPYTQFPVITHVDGAPATKESVVAYKAKIGKPWDIADHLTPQFAVQTTGYDCTFPDPKIEYGRAVQHIRMGHHILELRNGQELSYDILVSTVPLYALLRMVDITLPAPFRYDPIFVKVSERPPDAPYPPNMVYVNYLSDPSVAPYRLTDRDGSRHYESRTPMSGTTARKVVPGKIHPNSRSADMVRSLANQHIYCFGRYAAWLPEELIHETYDRIVAWAKVLGLATANIVDPAPAGEGPSPSATEA